MVDAGFFNDRDGTTRVGKLRINCRLTERQCVAILSRWYPMNGVTDSDIEARSIRQMKEDLRDACASFGSTYIATLNETGRANRTVKRLISNWG